MATCIRCRAERPHYGKGGGKLQSMCIDCRSRLAKEPSHRARVRASYRDNLPRMILDHAQRRARERGLIFDLTVEDISIPETCPVFGMRLEVGNGKRTDTSPTLDRIDPCLGYVRGNVWVISWRANRIKNDATLDELRQIVLALDGARRSREVA